MSTLDILFGKIKKSLEIKENGTLIINNENSIEDLVQELELTQQEKVDIQKRLALRVKTNKKNFECSLDRGYYDIFISIDISKNPFKASWERILSGTGWRYMKDKPSSWIDKMDGTWYGIASQKG